MLKFLKAFKESSLHNKIFWSVTLVIGILTLLMSLYPYLWFDQHRSGKQTTTKNHE